jgi:hypothetical protein
MTSVTNFLTLPTPPTELTPSIATPAIPPIQNNTAGMLSTLAGEAFKYHPVLTILFLAGMALLIICAIMKIINKFHESGGKIWLKTPLTDLGVTFRNGSRHDDTNGEDGKPKKFKRKTTPCDICKLNVARLVRDTSLLCSEIYYLEYVECVQKQFNELDDAMYRVASFVNDMHGRLVSNHIKEIGISDKKTRLYLKNTQILSYVWHIKKQDIREFFRQSIVHNNFHEKNHEELSTFANERSKVLIARLQGGENIFPDWDDPEIFVTKEMYEKELLDSITTECCSRVFDLYTKCKQIHDAYASKIKEKRQKIDELSIEFENSIPSF